MTRGTPIPAATIERIRRLLAAGSSLRETARRTATSPNTVRKYAAAKTRL